MSRAPLILAAIIMPSCAAIIITSSISLSASRSSLDETKMTVAYSCAYLAGQYAIMNGMPALFTGGRQTPDYCKPFEATAAKNGFSQK